MKVSDVAEKSAFKILNLADDAKEREIKTVYCCDLLSIAMSRMTDAAVWVTVMSNMNTLAVASLTDASCVILAEGVAADEGMLAKAKEQQISLFQTDLPVFEAASLMGKELGL